MRKEYIAPDLELTEFITKKVMDVNDSGLWPFTIALPEKVDLNELFGPEIFD